MIFGLSDFVVSLWFIPVLVALIDAIAPLRTRLGFGALVEPEGPPPTCDDFTLVVPIYGHIRYLTAVDYLRPYGPRVLLTTSDGETQEFYAALSRIASENGFRIHVARSLAKATNGRQTRQVGGTLRDTIVTEAHRSITSKYVVCIDADTETEEPIDQLVGRFEAADLDVASVRLEPANRNTLVARLQGHEYRMAMKLRRVMPWLVSGGCHIARREVHRDLMQRHSKFFQGNDVELGLLAQSLGYKVGHIPFLVPTIVPDSVKAWTRQRRAWAGGEFRIMIVNIRLSWRHPFLFFYGAIVMFALVPLRLYYVIHPNWPILTALAFYYLLVIAVNWKSRDRALLVYPIYALTYTMILIPLGIFSYLQMATRYHNAGVIRLRGEPRSGRVQVCTHRYHSVNRSLICEGDCDGTRPPRYQQLRPRRAPATIREAKHI